MIKTTEPEDKKADSNLKRGVTISEETPMTGKNKSEPEDKMETVRPKLVNCQTIKENTTKL